jgi:lysophospholipase L1-like esterase
VKTSKLRRFLVLGYASLFAWILLEVALYVVLPRPKFDTRLPFYPHLQHERDSIHLNGLSTSSTLTTNTWGFRGDEPPDDWDDYFTIVAVGGSTTHDRYLDDDLTWTALLQDHLTQTSEHVWVGNAGIAGHTTRGHILVMEEVITQIRPDMVVLLVGINDMGLSTSDEYRTQGSPHDQNRQPFLRYVLGHSRLFHMAERFYQIYFTGAVKVNDAYRNFEPEPIDPALETQLPDDLREALPQLPEYRDNLNRIIDIAQSIDAEILIMTQPSLFEDTDEWRALQGTSYFIQNQRYELNAADWWRLLDQYNQVTLDVCEARQVACYDLASQIPHSLDYFFDVAHFTEAGAALVAESVAGAVREQLWEGNSTPP